MTSLSKIAYRHIGFYEHSMSNTCYRSPLYFFYFLFHFVFDAMHAFGSDGSIDAISCVRLHGFWAPTLWFVHADAVFASSSVRSDVARVNHILTTTVLDAEVAN